MKDRKSDKHELRRKAFLQFSVAEKAAKRGDAVAEEKAIQEGLRVAASASGFWSWSASLVREYENELASLTEQSRLRRAPYLGTVGEFDFFADRIVTGDGSVIAMHSSTRATVETSGSLTVTQRPTLTRMAAGSLLPGSALIPGFALQKKKVHDSRKLYFVLEHPTGSALIEVMPQFEASARQLALEINQAARSAGRRIKSRRQDVEARGNEHLASLQQLASLRDSGVLTEHEFEDAKRKILDRL